MKQISEIERTASIAFNKQAPIFDEAFESNAIISYKRDRVRKHIIPFLKPGSNILELNCGTGNDAQFFASQGHEVHATDISEAMLEILNEKIIHSGYEQQVSSDLCSFTQLEKLQNKGPYDLIFSNFGG